MYGNLEKWGGGFEMPGVSDRDAPICLHETKGTAQLHKIKLGDPWSLTVICLGAGSDS